MQLFSTSDKEDAFASKWITKDEAHFLFTQEERPRAILAHCFSDNELTLAEKLQIYHGNDLLSVLTDEEVVALPEETIKGLLRDESLNEANIDRLFENWLPENKRNWLKQARGDKEYQSFSIFSWKKLSWTLGNSLELGEQVLSLAEKKAELQNFLDGEENA